MRARVGGRQLAVGGMRYAVCGVRCAVRLAVCGWRFGMVGGGGLLFVGGLAGDGLYGPLAWGAERRNDGNHFAWVHR